MDAHLQVTEALLGDLPAEGVDCQVRPGAQPAARAAQPAARAAQPAVRAVLPAARGVLPVAYQAVQRVVLQEVYLDTGWIQ
jgi:hypothetical protein